MGALDEVRDAAARADAILAAAGGKVPEMRMAVRNAHLALWDGLRALPDPSAAPGVVLAVQLCSFTPDTTAALRDRIRMIRRALAGESA